VLLAVAIATSVAREAPHIEADDDGNVLVTVHDETKRIIFRRGNEEVDVFSLAATVAAQAATLATLTTRLGELEEASSAAQQALDQKADTSAVAKQVAQLNTNFTQAIDSLNAKVALVGPAAEDKAAALVGDRIGSLQSYVNGKVEAQANTTTMLSASIDVLAARQGAVLDAQVFNLTTDGTDVDYVSLLW
jgi:hypothetical protein